MDKTGNCRIVTYANGYGTGVDLDFQSNGSLEMGKSDRNDYACIRSSGGKITSDTGADFDYWRFFHLAQNSTLNADHVRFYFGTKSAVSKLDTIRQYGRGTTDTNISPTLSVGHHIYHANTDLQKNKRNALVTPYKY